MSESLISSAAVVVPNVAKSLRGRADTKVLVDTIVQWISHHTSGLIELVAIDKKKGMNW